MIISDEQVRRVVEYLHTPDHITDSPPAAGHVDPSADFMRLVMCELQTVPDVRADRVAEAREMLLTDIPASDVVAGKLIGRVLSDSIR